VTTNSVFASCTVGEIRRKNTTIIEEGGGDIESGFKFQSGPALINDHVGCLHSELPPGTWSTLLSFQMSTTPMRATAHVRLFFALNDLPGSVSERAARRGLSEGPLEPRFL
jgi:hypothetical protein